MNAVIAFIFMFGLLVFVHEFGHLIFAKRAGMLVREFAIGFGPKILSFYKNETHYTIRLLPIGGYVRVAGEDPEIIELRPGHHVGLEFNSDSEVEKIIVNNKSKHPNARVIEVERVDLNHDLIIEGYELDKMDEKLSFQVHEKALFVMDERETQIAPYDRQFASKTVGQRAMQLFAGPMMNILLAALLFMLLGVMQGVPEDRAIIGSTEPGSPAAEAGIMEGDEIVEVDGTPIDEWEAFTIMIAEHPNEELQLKIKRDEEIIPMAVTPAEIEVEGETIGQLGVRLAFEKSVSKSLLYGFEQTYEITKLIIVNLVMLVTGQYSIDMLGGPVMIYDVTDQAVSLGIETFIMWTAMLSVNLGIINLVPLPALDGGRLLFVGIEAIRGKPIDPQKEGMVHFIGFALLMLLMIIVTWNDIQRLFM
ncbi:MAG TPA: RIP metalloprotease RseP [Bacillota bacterium]|nr:RIP metalloprotease RseP [Bacillota bacterium]